MPARTRNAEQPAGVPCKSSVGASHRNDSSVRCDQVVTTIMASQLLKEAATCTRQADMEFLLLGSHSAKARRHGIPQSP